MESGCVFINSSSIWFCCKQDLALAVHRQRKDRFHCCPTLMSFFQEEGEADKPFPVVRATGCNMSAEQKILVEVLLHTNETSRPNSFSIC